MSVGFFVYITYTCCEQAPLCTFIMFFEVISWIYVGICYAVFLQQFWISFIVWETCFCPVFIEKCGKYAHFPTVMTSYWYQITSTSAKLGSLKRKFYDLSENVYMSIVSEEHLWYLRSFMRHPFLVKML